MACEFAEEEAYLRRQEREKIRLLICLILVNMLVVEKEVKNG